MRSLIRTGSSAVLLLSIMFIGSLVMWIGVPLMWLWIGSQIQGATGSVGAAIGAMLVGVVVTIGAIVPVLGWLNRKHCELRESRGLESYGATALEAVLVLSAGAGVILFAIWFFLFAGTSPIPLNLSY